MSGTIEEGLKRIGLTVSKPILAIIAIIFGILVIVFPDLLSTIVGIYLIIQGLLFFLASTSFVIASILDTLPLSIVIIIVVRILLVLAAIEVYGAFLLPEWMKKLFLKQESS